jgi:hypothetical protein
MDDPLRANAVGIPEKPQQRTCSSMIADAMRYEAALPSGGAAASSLYGETGQAEQASLMRLPYLWRCPVDVAHLVMSHYFLFIRCVGWKQIRPIY